MPGHLIVLIVKFTMKDAFIDWILWIPATYHHGWEIHFLFIYDSYAANYFVTKEISKTVDNVKATECCSMSISQASLASLVLAAKRFGIPWPVKLLAVFKNMALMLSGELSNRLLLIFLFIKINLINSHKFTNSI